MTNAEFNQMISLMQKFSIHFEALAEKQEFERNDAKSKFLSQAVNMMLDDFDHPANKQCEINYNL